MIALSIVQFREQLLSPEGRVTSNVLSNHRPTLSLQPFTYEKNGYDREYLTNFKQCFPVNLSLLLSLDNLFFGQLLCVPFTFTTQ